MWGSRINISRKVPNDADAGGKGGPHFENYLSSSLKLGAKCGSYLFPELGSSLGLG